MVLYRCFNDSIGKCWLMNAVPLATPDFHLDVGLNAVNDSAAFIQRLKPDAGISEPVYRQLQRQIIQMIQSGELGDGDSLPSERTLAEALRLEPYHDPPLLR